MDYVVVVRKPGEKIPIHISASVRGSRPSRRKVVWEQFGLPGIRSAKHYGDSEKERREMQKKWRIKVRHWLRWPYTEGIFSDVKRKHGENIASRKKTNMIAEAIRRFWAYDTVCTTPFKKCEGILDLWCHV